MSPYNPKQHIFVAHPARYYDWSPYPTIKDVEYVPMLWGKRQIDQFVNTINQTIAEYKVTHVLGMNEQVYSPNLESLPSDTGRFQAAGAWPI